MNLVLWTTKVLSHFHRVCIPFLKVTILSAKKTEKECRRVRRTTEGIQRDYRGRIQRENTEREYSKD